MLEDVLLKRCATFVAGGLLIHDVVDDLTHLLLVLLQHLNLALHELGLAVHERLGDHVDVLRLHELLAHLGVGELFCGSGRA